MGTAPNRITILGGWLGEGNAYPKQCWSVWPVSIICLNQTNQRDKINQRDQTDPACSRRAGIEVPLLRTFFSLDSETMDHHPVAEISTTGALLWPRSIVTVARGKEEKVFRPTVLKPGDQVFYEKYETTEVDLDGKELVLVRESDVLGLVG